MEIGDGEEAFGQNFAPAPSSQPLPSNLMASGQNPGHMASQAQYFAQFQAGQIQAQQYFTGVPAGQRPMVYGNNGLPPHVKQEIKQEIVQSGTCPGGAVATQSVNVRQTGFPRQESLGVPADAGFPVRGPRNQAPPLYHPPISMSGPETPPFGMEHEQQQVFLSRNGKDQSALRQPPPVNSGPPCSPVTPTVTQAASAPGRPQSAAKSVAAVAPQPSSVAQRGRASSAAESGAAASKKRSLESPASVPPPAPKTPVTPIGNGPASVQPVSSVPFGMDKGANALTTTSGGCAVPACSTAHPPASSSTATSNTTILSSPIPSIQSEMRFQQNQPPQVSMGGLTDPSNMPIAEMGTGDPGLDPADDPLQKMAKLANQSLSFGSEPPMKQARIGSPQGPLMLNFAKEKPMIAPNDQLTPEQRQHREEALQKIERMRAQFCLSESATQPPPQSISTVQQNPAGIQCAPPPGYQCGPPGNVPVSGGPPGQIIRGPRPGVVMTSPGECMPGHVMMMTGPQGPQMQVLGPGPPHPGMIHIESTPQQQVHANLEWQKLRQEFEMEQYQKQNQDLIGPGPGCGIQPVSSAPTARPASAGGGKGARPRQQRPLGMPVPGTRMSLQQPGKPVVMVAPSNVVPPGSQRLPVGFRGQRLPGPRMLQEQHIAYISPEEQMMIQQQQQFMMGPGGQHPRARMMMQMQHGANMQMMPSGQPPPEMLMQMEGGGYGGPPEQQNFAADVGYMGEPNRGQYVQDFGGPPSAVTMDPSSGMMMGPGGDFYGSQGAEFDGANPGMKMQMMNSAGAYEMDVQGATTPIQGQPTVNNTYVNATMSIQQLNIQNVGPPIHQLHGSSAATPPLGTAGGQSFPFRGGPAGNVRPAEGVQEAAAGGGEFGMPPFSFQSMPEPLTNLDSKVPSQKLQYFPTSKPSGGSSSSGGPSVPSPVQGTTETQSQGVPPPGSIPCLPPTAGNQMVDNFNGNGFESPLVAQQFRMGQSTAPVSQAQYGSFENFQQQLYASNSNGGSKQ